MGPPPPPGRRSSLTAPPIQGPKQTQYPITRLTRSPHLQQAARTKLYEAASKFLLPSLLPLPWVGCAVFRLNWYLVVWLRRNAWLLTKAGCLHQALVQRAGGMPNGVI
jgi:hypothetical protein